MSHFDFQANRQSERVVPCGGGGDQVSRFRMSETAGPNKVAGLVTRRASKWLRIPLEWWIIARVVSLTNHFDRLIERQKRRRSRTSISRRLVHYIKKVDAASR